MAINRDKVLKKAQKQVRKRNWKKALRQYRKLVDDDPGDMRSRLKCGDLYARLEREDEAVEAYKAVGDNYAQDERYQKAIAVYKQAKRLNSEDVALYHAIGECHYRLGRLKDAIRTFNDVQKMYEERGASQRQREVLEHMVRIDPDDVGLRIQLAERYTDDGFHDEALESFTYCADVLEDEGRLDELIQVLERIVFLASHRHDLRKQLVRLYLDRQDNEEALKHLQICFRELPGDIDTLEMLAQTFERLGRDDKAVMVLEELAPHYEEDDRQADAENLYRRLLRLDPDNETALEALGEQRPSGPDSGIVAGPADTGSLEGRQHTPAPADDGLGDVEFLDDDDGFDDDIEFLDDDLVAEAAPDHASDHQPQASAPPPEQPSPPPSSSPPSPRPSTPAPSPEEPSAEPTDLTDEIELIDDDVEPIDDDVEPIDDIEAIDDIEPIDEVEPIEDIEPVDDESRVQEILSECDVFLKYGLYDKALSAINDALDEFPESIYAHRQLLKLHEATGNTEQRCQTLLALATLTADDTPAAAYDYLQDALDIADDPLAVKVEARALDIDLDAPRPDDELDIVDVDPDEVIDDEPETIHVEIDSSEVEVVDDDSSPEDDGVGDEISFLDPDEFEAEPDDDDDPFGAALDGLDDAFDSLDRDSGPSADLSESTDVDDVPESTVPDEQEPISALDDSFDDADVDSLEEHSIELDDDATVPEIETPDLDDTGLGADTDSSVVADDDLQFDDADDFVEMDLDDGAGFDDADLQALDEESEANAAERSDSDVNALFSDVEADDLFDDLFGEGDAPDDADINIGGDDPQGEMAEIDFFIQQGLTEEAAEALAKFERDNPNHPGIPKRRNQLQQVRSGLSAEENPFGAESLSQQFDAISVGDESSSAQSDEAANFDSVVNSNLELGQSYREMGLLEEAIDEFRQATDDPDAAPSAHYHIGLCELDLGREQSAQNTFHQVLEMDGASDDVVGAAREKLDELEAQAS